MSIFSLYSLARRQSRLSVLTMLNRPESFEAKRIDIWDRLLGRGTNARRQDGAKQFYPILDRSRTKAYPLEWVTTYRWMLAAIMLSLTRARNWWHVGRFDPTTPRDDWQISAEYAPETESRRALFELGAYARTRGRWSISYLRNAERQRINRGEIEVTGRDQNGSLIVEALRDCQAGQKPGDRLESTLTQCRSRVDRISSGRLTRDRKFPFPKSLYAVEDALRFFVAKTSPMPSFSTSSPALARLPMPSCGSTGRTAAAASASPSPTTKSPRTSRRRLRKKGLRPGDPDWEKRGICDYITKPRIAGRDHRQDAGRRADQGRLQVHRRIPDGRRLRGERRVLHPDLRDAGRRQPQPRLRPHRAAAVAARGQRGPAHRQAAAAGWDVADTYGLLVRPGPGHAFPQGRAQDQRPAHRLHRHRRRPPLPGGRAPPARRRGAGPAVRVVPDQFQLSPTENDA